MQLLDLLQGRKVIGAVTWFENHARRSLLENNNCNLPSKQFPDLQNNCYQVKLIPQEITLYDLVCSKSELIVIRRNSSKYFLLRPGAWIVKPVASSRGRGIFIVNHPNQVLGEEK